MMFCSTRTGAAVFFVKVLYIRVGFVCRFRRPDRQPLRTHDTRIDFFFFFFYVGVSFRPGKFRLFRVSWSTVCMMMRKVCCLLRVCKLLVESVRRVCRGLGSLLPCGNSINRWLESATYIICASSYDMGLRSTRVLVWFSDPGVSFLILQERFPPSPPPRYSCPRL